MNAPFLDALHDHAHCVTTALAEADNVCKAHGVRLTALRRRVLELLWQNHRPTGAYGLLEQLRADGRSAAPPTVYRALEFLVEHGLAHRLASLNAFVGCAYPGHPSPGQFLICEGCGDAAELNDVQVEYAVARSAAALGFEAHRHTIEVTGLCPHCLAGGRGHEHG